MLLLPAIDLRHGRCVRLRQGDPAAETVFGDDPAAMARHWAALGAEWLHIVNLDGALGDSGPAGGERPLNLQRLSEIRNAVEIPIQFGGGLRRLEDIELALDLGATRVVLGTAAVRDPGLVRQAIGRFGARQIVAGIDARDGRVATHGWTETSDLLATTLALVLADMGLRRLVYTDISRDGMLAGVNLAATVELARSSGLAVIASGGVSGLADIEALAGHEADGVEGAIIGQALYSGALDLGQALAAARRAGEA